MVNVGQAVGYLMLDTKGWSTGFASAKKDLQTFGSESASVTDKLNSASSLLNKAGKGLTVGVTLPIVGVGAAAIKTASEFEKAMSAVQAVTLMSKDEMGALKEAALASGMATKYTATEAAEALLLLGQAGYDQAQMIASLPSVLNLAAAGDIEMARAAEILTNSLNALGLSSKDSETQMRNLNMMVDQLAVAAAASSVDVTDMGESLIAAGGILRNLSGGLTEANVALAILGDNGIKGSEAGIKLRNIILAMNPTTKEAREAWDQLGISAFDAQGNLRPLEDIIKDLDRATAGMTQEEKLNIMSKIFNKTDLAAIQALMGTTEERWTSLTNEITNSSGAAGEMAKTQMDNLDGSLTVLKSSIESLMITIGDALIPIIQDVVGWIQGWIDKLNAMTPEQRKQMVTIALIIAAIGPLLLILAKLITIIKGVSVAMAMLSANPIVLLIAVIVAAIVALTILIVKNWDQIKETTIRVWNAIKDFIVRLWESIKQIAINVWNAIKNFFADTWNAIKNTATSVWDGIKNFFTGTWNNIKNIAVGAWNGIKNAISSIWDATVNWIKTGINNIVGFFTSLPTTLYNAGKNAIQSFWNGLKSIWETVKKWFSDTFGWIVDLVNTVGGWLGFNRKTSEFSNTKPHATGLDYVPYDNYYARLHKGERVLTAQENKAFSTVATQKGGNTYNFYSPKALDPVTSKQMFDTARKQEALGIDLG